MCRPELTVSHDLPVLVQYHDDDNSSDNGVATSDLTLYIGLAVAFLIFVLVVFIIVRLLKRKRNPHPSYSYTPAGYARQSKPPGPAYGPDITQGTNQQTGTVCYEYGYSDNNSNNSVKSAKAGLALSATHFSELRPLSEHFYEQPMRLLPPAAQQTGSASSSLERPDQPP